MLRTRLIAGPTAGFVLSAVFATLMTLVNVAETFFEPLRVDPSAPAPVTLRLPPMTLRVPDEDGGAPELKTMSVTVRRGEVVGDRIRGSLVRMYERGRRPPRVGTLVGLWFVYLLIAQMLVTYMRSFSPSRGALLRTQAGLIGMSLVLLIAAKVFLLLTDFSPFVVPVAAVSLWAALYLDRRTAFFVTFALAFLTASLVGFRLSAVAVFLASGTTAITFFRDRKHSSNMIVSGALSGVAAAAVLIAAEILFESGFDVRRDVARLWHSDLLSAAAGGVLAGLIAFSLQGVAVLVLGAVSRARLIDLTDLDQPLLKKMASQAPGSWEHARAMANLAEAASAAVGADPLLTRVGAYYHDLGKSVQPKYFVENLEPGERSPHENLDPDVSADAIMAHVVEGTKILRRYRIPEPVVEFAYTHHGTSVTEYFWHKCLEQGNPKGLKESFFRYPGMRPRTKETAILMLVDSIEAAARTIDPPSRERFSEMVQRIFFVKLRQGQLDECGLTPADVRILTTKLTDTLCSFYHSRIKYPWQDRQERGEEQLPVAGVATEEDVRRDREESAAEASKSQEREVRTANETRERADAGTAEGARTGAVHESAREAPPNEGSSPVSHGDRRPPEAHEDRSEPVDAPVDPDR